MGAPTKILAMVRTVIATRTILDGRFVSGRVSLAEVVDASGCPRRPVLRVLERLAHRTARTARGVHHQIGRAHV